MSLIEKICLSIAEPKTPDFIDCLQSVPEEIIWLELRLDFLQDLSLSNIQNIISSVPADKKTIVTCRGLKNGGEFKGSDDDQIQILQAALDFDVVEFVDVDSSILTLAKDYIPVTKTLLSSHIFESITLEQAQAKLQDILKLPAQIYKLAWRVDGSDRIEDLNILFTGNADNKKIIAVPMRQEDGAEWRLKALQYGSRLSFVAAKNSLAPGQPTLDKMVQLIRSKEN